MPEQKKYQTAPNAVLLRSGDVLSISISTLPTSQLNTYSNADLQSTANPILNGYTVSQKGSILLPVIGEVVVAGRTIDQTREEIAGLVSEYFQNASVKVHLLSFTISILGEVAQPGQYTVYKENISLLDGLALGGDLLPSADRNRVSVIRAKQGVTTRYNIDLQQDEIFTAPHFYLQPDDVIYVEPARYRSINPMQPWAIAVSSLSVIAVILNIFLK
uniref:Polysaccharide biosynthesis/export family protein n=1 Tax=Roseihalotalea indica TaxID=2867963 RepID=A0AA49JIE4_9BACT|nr:polysaccharide biosynthesis/export family protein [Tunicatimonas sp. TK19036]WKN34632.1 polysaccharide biosynthesis/export family protein [Tunicatimonas sp. TK19036]